MNTLTHLDEHGAARMVDVSGKPETVREAKAEAIIVLSADAFEAVTGGSAPKGDVLAAARLAGIMAAKKTSELIPLCHPIPLSGAEIAIEPLADRNAFRIVASARTSAQTGVEMEALVAAGIAALTIYDMTKAIDRAGIIEGVRLLSKSGGKSGAYAAKPHGVASARKPRMAGAPREGIRVAAVVEADRTALRTFMVTRRLRATEWAKKAGVPAAQIFAFLTGRAPALPPSTAEALARAAKVRVEDMFAPRTK
jgi:cyclic pyranopterin phosphate synthase